LDQFIISSIEFLYVCSKGQWQMMTQNGQEKRCLTHLLQVLQ
jgi:hypothetical protein